MIRSKITLDFISEAFEDGGIVGKRKPLFDALGVKPVLETIGIAEGCAAVILVGGKRGHGGSLGKCRFQLSAISYQLSA